MRHSLQDIEINYSSINRMTVNFAGEVEKKYVSNFTDITIKEYPSRHKKCQKSIENRKP